MRISEQVWILDDDSSIRWVLGKSTSRGQTQHRQFCGGRIPVASLRNIPASRNSVGYSYAGHRWAQPTRTVANPLPAYSRDHYDRTL